MDSYMDLTKTKTKNEISEDFSSIWMVMVGILTEDLTVVKVYVLE
jgi:hypothetical protein